jgi:hypothetical protein
VTWSALSAVLINPLPIADRLIVVGQQMRARRAANVHGPFRVPPDPRSGAFGADGGAMVPHGCCSKPTGCRPGVVGFATHIRRARPPSGARPRVLRMTIRGARRWPYTDRYWRRTFGAVHRSSGARSRCRHAVTSWSPARRFRGLSLSGRRCLRAVSRSGLGSAHRYYADQPPVPPRGP